jgi:Domain of unknown function (DUF4157)
MNQRMLLRKPASASAEPQRAGSSLRLSKPGDTFEQEADRVADAVMGGGRIPAWSIANVGMGTVQRDTPDGSGQQQAPKPNNYSDAGLKLLEAFLKTDAGKKFLDAVEHDPLVKDTKAFVSSTPGIIVAGTAAAGVVAGLGAAHKPLPFQIPAVPIDSVIPALKGVKAQITVQGPLDHPTQIMIGFSGTFGGGGSKAKKDDPSARIAQEKREVQQSLDMFKPKDKGSSGDVAEWLKFGQGAATPGSSFEDFGTRRPFAPLPGTQGIPLAPAKQTGGKPSDAPLVSPTGKDSQEKKEEEVPVQRKAGSREPACASSEALDEGLSSSSRPLDVETRSLMESRFGHDFSRVKIHTGEAASRSARALGALAYTVGDSVVFDAGHYAPGNAEGRRLLAHELTHVVQQSQPDHRARQQRAHHVGAAQASERPATGRSVTP